MTNARHISDGKTTNTMKSTIITASAGTGKTWTITEELADRIRGGLSPSAIIATTFTTKAAGELSERIRTKLMDHELVAQAQAIGSALVGTVNSVAATLVRDFAIDAGLSPELETLTEDAAARAFELACDETIADVEDRHRSLLRRTGHDRPVDAYEHDARVSFSRVVREIAEAARQNLIAPEDLAAGADDSADDLLAVLDQIAEADAADERATWARDAVAACRAAIELDAGDERNAAVNRRRKFADLAATLSGPVDRITWNEWAGLAEVKSPKPIAAEFADFADIAQDIAASPAYREDMTTLTRLVLDTAARCLVAYDAHKKSLGLIDFTDQEVLALGIIRSSATVRAAIAETYEVLVVDEFQDTNPIQLALFFELGTLAGEVIWVGDPKQSIYGFRGSDPQLMSATIDALAVDGRPRVLDESWRSFDHPLALTNELFSATMPDADVRLTVAAPMARDHAGGDVRVWRPSTDRGTSNAPWFGAITGGVASLLDEGLSPGDVAVLARSKSHVEAIVSSLTEAGIPCTGDKTDLRAVREGQAIRAALGFLLDDRDGRALVELIVLLDDHRAHGTWFAEMTAEGTDRASRAAMLDEWAADPALEPLRSLRAAAVNLTPVECVRQVIDALDLRRRIVGWTRPSRRMGSLDAFAGLAREYQDEAASAGTATSLSGFLTWFDAVEERPAAGGDADSVYVGTMHSSKGLEWKAVCVAVPKPKDKFSPSGHWVASRHAPTLQDPLGDRHLRFWPSPPSKAKLIVEAMAAHPIQKERAAAEIEDARRLAYVSLTRASKHSILCARSGFEGFDGVKGTDVTMTVGDDEIIITDGDGTATPVPACVEAMDWNDEDARRPATSRHRPGIDALRGLPRAERLAPARVAPSSITATPEQTERAAVTERATLGAPIVSGGAEHWERVGEAVHGYLGLPLAHLDEATRAASAARLVDAWGVGAHIDADGIVALGDRWLTWLDAEFPGAVPRTEVPVTWRNDLHQIHEGWIDQLLELPGGGVILVDHKTYPGDDPIGHVKKNYIGQLSGYADALELAGRGRPAEILVHLPLKGSVVAIRP
ncbi:exodeoxyribonuclease V subunit beta [uncultured Corynebacterium sp.]|uniref:UvrD-helicase domain-containing protein n=1 Tax=uncultured Corynebacterium sp. TaxID=159447 RepID=UPI0025FEBD41|nr:UvrD-helicase domain-containing protein [uncultured Corynebacterium sp.]